MVEPVNKKHQPQGLAGAMRNAAENSNGWQQTQLGQIVDRFIRNLGELETEKEIIARIQSLPADSPQRLRLEHRMIIHWISCAYDEPQPLLSTRDLLGLTKEQVKRIVQEASDNDFATPSRVIENFVKKVSDGNATAARNTLKNKLGLP